MSKRLPVTEAGDHWPEVFQRRMRPVYLAGYHIAQARRAAPPCEREAAHEDGRRFIKTTRF